MRWPELQSVRQRKLSLYKNILQERATNEELMVKKVLESLPIKVCFQAICFSNDYQAICDFRVDKPYRVYFEIDGRHHESFRGKDDWRTRKILSNHGKYKVIRLTNDEIRRNRFCLREYLWGILERRRFERQGEYFKPIKLKVSCEP